MCPVLKLYLTPGPLIIAECSWNASYWILRWKKREAKFWQPNLLHCITESIRNVWINCFFGIWDENGTFKWLLQIAVKWIASLEAAQLFSLFYFWDYFLWPSSDCDKSLCLDFKKLYIWCLNKNIQCLNKHILALV